MYLKEKIFAGEGEIKADILLKSCRIVNVITKEIIRGDIALKSGFIVGTGDVGALIDEKTKIYDLKDKYVCPGLIDGHVHFESSMLTLTQFAKQSLAHGTTGIVIDPHEIANVLGTRGIELVLDEAKKLPMEVFITIPSCVPATDLETSGARIGLSETKKLLDFDFVVGLAEVMDYPDVLRGNAEKIAMIEATLKKKLLVDGHCPGMRGKDLFGYLCAGISSDHESITYEEALEKARLGMAIMLREGSAAKSLDNFVPQLLRDGISYENFFFVSDDKHPQDLLKGHMDTTVRKAISLGIPPIYAVSMCTLNTARHFRIDQLVGSISIGRRADLIVLNDLQRFSINTVIARGRILPELKNPQYPDTVFDTIKIRDIKADDLSIKCDKTSAVHVIDILPDQIFTERSVESLKPGEGQLQADVEKDVLSIAVLERHGKNGNIGKGFIRGFGLKEGAFAQSIAHDSHNIATVGTNFYDMALCVKKIKQMHGGIAIANNGIIKESLKLSFAGLLSTESAESVSAGLKDLNSCIKELGCKPEAPFSVLSFLSLPVIPRLKITDRGLIDVEKFKIIDPIVDFMES